ncbi:hypothetical protein HMI56_005525 [Coelomomyces lativittatus]|nr:hypothetical protein HMI56_005525 [Coelomomyces lativittatus]
MLNDVALSIELSHSFSTSKYTQSIPFDLSITLCQDTIWSPLPGLSHPPSSLASLHLPSSLVHAMDQFTQFYLHHHGTGRVLTWHHELSTLVLKVVDGWSPTKELTVSMYMGLILLAFNLASRYTFTALQKVTGISDVDVLQKTLHAMVLGPFPVLERVPFASTSSSPSTTPPPPSAPFSLDTSFQLVSTWTSNKLKLNFTQLPPSSSQTGTTALTNTMTTATSTSTSTPSMVSSLSHLGVMGSFDDDLDLEHVQVIHEKVVEDQVAVIDAAIVRVLKSNKRMGHAALLKEVANQCTFLVENN